MRLSIFAAAAALPALAFGYASTDSYMDADVPQSGYLPNHNVDPTKLSTWAIQWSLTFNTNEQAHAKPLVYTPTGFSHEVVIVVSNLNIIRVIDGLSGQLLYTRTLDPPFTSGDASCGDIPNFIGITGTPIIDTATDIMYFYSKGYKGGAPSGSGTINGEYKLYAVKIPTLTDVDGFPLAISGVFADNDHTRYVVPGTVLQRPSLQLIGNSVVAGFGGHCDNWNYTGLLLTASKTKGVGVTSVWAMVASPGAASPQPTLISDQTGGKSGIWASGMGIAYDQPNNRVFFATGNSRGPGENGANVPRSGKAPISTMPQSICNFGVNPTTGKLSQVDYFAPFNYDSLGGDADVGSSGVALLDGSTFSGGGVNRIAIAGSKAGNIYVCDADNLGGFMNGANNGDAILQQIVASSGSFFGGLGSYPLEGGYIYFSPTGNSLFAYKFGMQNGKPFFTQAGKTAQVFAGQLIPTVTTLNGQPGTGVVWMADINTGLLAYKAVPENGVLVPIPLGSATGRLQKFQRPAFGNARVYTLASNKIWCQAAPGAPPPVSSVTPGTSSTTTKSTTSVAPTSSTTTSIATTSTSSSVVVVSSSTSSSTSTTTSVAVVTSSSTTIPSVSTSTSSTLGHKPTVGSYAFVSCWAEGATVKALAAKKYAYDAMTLETCMQNCTGFAYWGAEYGRECYCGNTLDPSSSAAALADCKDVCKGNPLEYCGAGNRLELYSTITNLPTSTSTSTKPVSTSPGSSTTSVFLTSTIPSSSAVSTSSTTSPSSTTSSLTSTSSSLTSSSPTDSSSSTTSVSPTSSTTSPSTGSSPSTTTSSPTDSPSSTTSSSPTDSSSSTTSVSLTSSTTSSPSDSSSYSTSVSLTSSTTFSPTDSPSTTNSAPTDSTSSMSSSSTDSSSSTMSPSTTTSLSLTSSSSTFSTASTTSSSSAPTSSAASSSSTNSLSSRTSSVSVITSVASSSTSVLTTSTTVSASPTFSCTAPATPSANPKSQTRTFTWNITWVNASPDGFARPFIGINNQWPCPAINVNMGDQIKINVINGLGNETTAIHFHGMYQKNTTFADGPAMVTQCPIQPGQTFVYQFFVNQPGTYWYHAHIGGQYIDGLRGPLIVTDTMAPFCKSDSDVVLTLSDLYHQQAPPLINYYLSSANIDATGGAEPIPDAVLMNEAQNVKISITPGKTYKFRIINMGAMAAHWLQFDQHTMTIVEVDGVYTQPKTVNQLFVGVAQRYSVLVTAKATATQNFAIVSYANADMFDSLPANGPLQVNGWLVYDGTKALPAPFDLSSQLQPFDDSSLVPYDGVATYGPVTQTLYYTADFGVDGNSGGTRAFFNGVTYLPQKVPTLYTALTAPADSVNNPVIYGANSNPTVIPFGAIVEVNINNHDTRAHPFHLHGHNFQVLTRDGGGTLFPGRSQAPTSPMRRDTVVVYAQGSATIRFVADNPGINLFHCHTEWHVEGGLTATFIEAPDVMQSYKLYVPVSHRDVCDAQGILRKGNAAGNSNVWTDMTGANTIPPSNDWGALINPPA